MRVALLHINYGGPLYNGYQLGIASIASTLLNNGVKCKIFIINNDADLERVTRYQPKIIGIYSIETYKAYIDIFSQYLKSKLPKSIIVIGGPYPTCWPSCLHEFKYIDAIFIGEGEIYFTVYCKTLNPNVPGLLFKTAPGCIITPRLTQKEFNMLPMPYRDTYLIPAIEACTWDKYGSGPGMLHFMFSRGCPFTCGYCCNSVYNKTMGTNIRFRDISLIQQEIHDAVSNFEFGTLVFEDDILTLNQPWFNEFMCMYKSFGMPFEINTHPNCLQDYQIHLLAEAGCQLIRLGIESGSSKIRRIMGRQDINNMDLINLFTKIYKEGIDTTAYNIVGLPMETQQDFEETCDLNLKLKILASQYDCSHNGQLTIFYPTRGTRLGEYCHKKGYVVKTGAAHEECVIESPRINPDIIRRRMAAFPR